MAVKIPISGAAQGTTGSAFGATLTFLAKAVGNYLFTEANFAGLGKSLPGWLYIMAVPAATSLVQIAVTSDGGTTWRKASVQATNAVPAGFLVWADANSIRLEIATAASDVYIVPLAQ